MSAVHYSVANIDVPEGIEFHRYECDPSEPNPRELINWTPYVILQDGVWSDGVPLEKNQLIYCPEWEGSIYLNMYKLSGLSKDKDKYDKIQKEVESWVILAEQRDKRKVSREQR